MNVKLLKALEFANEYCRCESYYLYQCDKCKTIAEGKMPNMEKADKLGYIDWKAYGAPKLTINGQTILRHLKKEK